MIANFPHATIAACFSSKAAIDDPIVVISMLKALFAQLDCEELRLAEGISGAQFQFAELAHLPAIVMSGQAKARENRHV